MYIYIYICPLSGLCRRCARVSPGGIAVEASGTAVGAAAGILDPTPAEASGRALSSELQPSRSVVSRFWSSVMEP